MTDSKPPPAHRLRRIAAAAVLALACGSGATQPATAQDEAAADIAGPAAVGDRILQVGGGFDVDLPRPRPKAGAVVASPMPAILNSDIRRLGRYLPGGAVILDRRIEGQDHQLGFDSGAGLEPLSSTDPLSHLFPGYYVAIEKSSALDRHGPRRVHFGIRYPDGLVAFTPRPPDDGDRYRWRWGTRPGLVAVAIDPYLDGAPGLRLDLYQRQDDETLDPLASIALSGATDIDRWLAGHLARSGRYRLAAHMYRRDDLFTPVELAGFDFELALEAPPDDPEGQAPRPAPGDIRLSLLSAGPVSAYAPAVTFEAAIPAELQPGPAAPALPDEILATRLFPADPLPPAQPSGRTGPPAASAPGRREPAVPGGGIPEFKVPEFKVPELRMPELKVPGINVPGINMPGRPTDRSGAAARPAPDAALAGRYFVRLIRLPFDSYFCMRLGPLEEGAHGAALGQHAAGGALREAWQKVGADGRISIPVPRHPGRYRLKLYRLDSAGGRTFALYANAHADFEVVVPWQAGRLSLGPQVVRQAPDQAPPPGGFGVAVQAQLPAGAGKGWSVALYRPPSRLGDGEDLPRHFAGADSLDPENPQAFLGEDLHRGQWEVMLRDPLNRVVDRARFQVAGLDPVLRIDGKLQQTAEYAPIRVPRLSAPDPDWPGRADPRRGLSAWQKAPFACRDPVFPSPPELRVVRLDAGDWSDPEDDRFLPVDALVPGHPYFVEAAFDAAPAAGAYPLRIDGRRMIMLRQTEEPRLFRTDTPVTLIPPRQGASR